MPEVTAGLDKVSLLPVRSGYLELGGEVRPSSAAAFAEVGYRPLEWMGLFGRGEWDSRDGARAYGGLRVTF